MKAKAFSVSIQWGGGFHYFVTTHDTEAEARSSAQHHRNRLRRYKQQRGAKPEVNIWRRINADDS